jgi:hypothetical protein
MSSCMPRRALPVLVVLAGLALPFPAQAAPVRPGFRSSAVLESLPASVWKWASRLWPAALQKNGSMVDPNGTPVPAGGTNGAAPRAGGAGDNGSMVDPDG